jgi:hypothetical protein
MYVQILQSVCINAHIYQHTTGNRDRAVNALKRASVAAKNSQVNYIYQWLDA